MTEQTAAAPSSTLSLDLIITCADGLEAPLQTELTSFGIDSEIKSTGRLAVTGDSGRGQQQLSGVQAGGGQVLYVGSGRLISAGERLRRHHWRGDICQPDEDHY